MENATTSGAKILTSKQKGLNRHWKNFVAKNYLGSHNLEVGEEMLLTIAKFEGEELVQKVDGKKDEKVPKQVLYFKENVPKMIMNVTNGNTLTKLYGSHPENWIGKQIQVYVAKVRAFGQEQDALRIRDVAPKREVDVVEYTMRLEAAKTPEELTAIWKTFPVSAQKDAALINNAKAIKARLCK